MYVTTQLHTFFHFRSLTLYTIYVSRNAVDVVVVVQEQLKSVLTAIIWAIISMFGALNAIYILYAISYGAHERARVHPIDLFGLTNVYGCK